ncbi:ATP-dependent RNA helicase SrmB [Clostridiaceae bacterium BL-3]|nr:ATP-dependent RNA helicase SrmB [Clostridiaceae bacterium BL-3]
MSELGIRKIHERLKAKLANYIKAQYFAENDLLLEATKSMLNEEGVLFREPFIEATQNYKVEIEEFKNADLDENIKRYLDYLIKNKLGVFDTPFSHQVKALEAFYHDKDMLVTTGTGSGKTECFLWPILTEMIRQAAADINNWEQEGIRALILYPMNALVSDQLGRIRNIVGRADDAYMELMKQESNDNVRRLRFGMYTGRTPYPGKENEDKNKELAKSLRGTYSQENEYRKRVYEELKKAGKIPAKDLNAFIHVLDKEIQVTGNNDAELLTRTEMQQICPDILITNYSMLEFMLMRPIEQCFWEKTRKWLKRSINNKFLLVIDEAHMYRGAAGGEVSLLIRRLLDKLDISREQVKCILTSASVPSNSEKELREFACGLTGQSLKKDKFSIIEGEKTPLLGHKKGNKEDVNCLLQLDYDKLQGNEKDLEDQLIIISQLFKWGKITGNYNNWLYEKLSEYPPMLELIKLCSGSAVPFKKIAKCVFKGVSQEDAEKATEILLALGALSRSRDGKVLLPAKVHLLFRGINGIYACINPECKDNHEIMGVKIGHISNEPSFTCPKCGGRVFELVGDRRCGTLFIRAFKESEDIGYHTFLWQDSSKFIDNPREIHLWLASKYRTKNDIFKEGVKNSKSKKESIFGYINSQTGILYEGEEYSNKRGFIRVLIPRTYDKDKKMYTFRMCPNCGREKNNPTPFRVRGNEPFANLVTEQLIDQPVKNAELKNEGKKVLLFSDSRQRAATLARDLTIATDGDAGRQAIFMAQKELDKRYGEEQKSLDILYYAFLKVVEENKISFFYGDEKKEFNEQLERYRQMYGSKNKKRLDYERMARRLGSPPKMFYQLLLKNISDSYRSFNNLCLGQVILLEKGEDAEELEELVLKEVKRSTGLDVNIIRNIYNTWIQNILVKDIAIFPSVSDEVRNSILPFDKGNLGIGEEDKFPKYLIEILKSNGINKNQIEEMRKNFVLLLADVNKDSHVSHNNRYLLPSNLMLKTNENGKWYRCNRCSGTSTFTLFDSCIYCGSKDYLSEMSQKDLERYDFWRKPVIEAIQGRKIKNFVTDEHTAQLSHKSQENDVWATTEKNEMLFRNIVIKKNSEPIDILSCTTTMEVGIDIGSLTAVGLRNVPPMRENYQQRSGRAGRKGAAVSTIVTYTENGPHDAWYFNNPGEIISGDPRIPWIDYTNEKLIGRHLNLILLQEFFMSYEMSMEDINVINFFSEEVKPNYLNFIEWLKNRLPLAQERVRRLIPDEVPINWDKYRKDIIKQLQEIKVKVNKNPIIYRASKKCEEDEKEKYISLMNELFTEGLLPTYSFPRDIVHFWLENKYGKVEQSPERSIDIALSEYAPGRMLVIDKKSYISGGLYDYYTKYNKEYSYRAAEPWLKMNEYNKRIYCCENHDCGWFGLENKTGVCPLCGGSLREEVLIKPWGFTARDGMKIPEVRDNQEYSIVSKPSYASVYGDTSKMESISKTGLIHMENRKDQQLILVNKGPDDEGFDLCTKCGAIDPCVSPDKDKRERKRPYKVSYKWKKDIQECSHTRQKVFLGCDIHTDMLVLELKLENEYINIDKDSLNIWIIPAATSLSEALALAASKVLDIEFSDLRSGYRLRYGRKSIYVDIYLYDSLSSGAGYANRVADLIEEVMDEAENRLKKCNCETACPNCLQNFWNQSIRENLDRKAGLQLLNWVKKGELAEVEREKEINYMKTLEEIAKLQEEPGRIVKGENDYWINIGEQKKKIKIYPAMCNTNKIDRDKETILIPDRLFKVSIANVWKIVEKHIDNKPNL